MIYARAARLLWKSRKYMKHMPLGLQTEIDAVLQELANRWAALKHRGKT